MSICECIRTLSLAGTELSKHRLHNGQGTILSSSTVPEDDNKDEDDDEDEDDDDDDDDDGSGTFGLRLGLELDLEELSMRRSRQPPQKE